jgi:hypothetical protein
VADPSPAAVSTPPARGGRLAAWEPELGIRVFVRDVATLDELDIVTAPDLLNACQRRPFVKGAGPRRGLGKNAGRGPEIDVKQRAKQTRFHEADDGTRTHDTWLGKPVLYRLSYVRAPRILAA